MIVCLSFPSRDRATAPGQFEYRDAIPNTTKEVCYQIRLDPDGVVMLSFRRAGSGGEC
jgi:hypothetical protein